MSGCNYLQGIRLCKPNRTNKINGHKDVQFLQQNRKRMIAKLMEEFINTRN